MEEFRTDIEIESLAAPGRRFAIGGVLVDSRSALTRIPTVQLGSLGVGRSKQVRFRLVDGRVLERWVGGARVFAAGTSTGDDIVFAEPGDAIRLGARTLSGLNVRVDSLSGELVDAGPAPAARAA